MSLEQNSIRPEVEKVPSPVTGSVPKAQTVLGQPVSIQKAFDSAARQIAPMWDLRDYVAVNPFFGMNDRPFLNTLEQVMGSTQASLLPPMSFFKERWDSGLIQETDLRFAIEKVIMTHGESDQAYEVSRILDTTRLVQALDDTESEAGLSELKNRALSDFYDYSHGYQKHSDSTVEVAREVSKWLSAYFDEGQAQWKMPFSDERLFLAWRNLAEHDQTLKGKLGLDLPKLVLTLPHDPWKAIEKMTRKLMLVPQVIEGAGGEGSAEFQNHRDLWTTECLSRYFYRLMCSVAGWASFVQKIEFEAQRTGDSRRLKQVGGLVDLLAIRMAYDLLFLEHLPEVGVSDLQDAKTETAVHQLPKNYIWLLAYEHSYRRRMLFPILKSDLGIEVATPPQAQMAFCIDVRSEVIRRHIESALPGVETIGFAGFFGLPMDYQGLGHQTADQQCPVLLNSKVTVPETVRDEDQKSDPLDFEKFKFKKLQEARKIRMKKSIQQAANSCFSFVETFGGSYAVKMLKNALGWSRPNLDIRHLGLSKSEAVRVRPDTAALDLDTRVAMGFGALKNMGLTERFAKYVFLLGHSSESANNPYAAGLDCGACAGHSGISNSRVLADILNDSVVRSRLASEKGIEIPATTRFVSGIHNTTLDVLELDDVAELIESDSQFSKLCEGFKRAEAQAQLERSEKLAFCKGLTPDQLQKELKQKSMDWSEIRPEWALAGNAAFLVGRRERSRHLKLDGRSFMHEYKTELDTDGSVLELIMTAPMVVTNWINMQYFASSVDPMKFGSGNKTTHNVVGTIGVIQGNQSDLQVGLSLQSVKYRDHWIHEPVRLQVVIEAETSKIEAIIAKHALVKNLIENEWLNVIALDPQSNTLRMYEAGGWLELAKGTTH